MKHLFFILMLWTFSAIPSFSINILWDGGGDNVTWTDPFLFPYTSININQFIFLSHSKKN